MKDWLQDLQSFYCSSSNHRPPRFTVSSCLLLTRLRGFKGITEASGRVVRPDIWMLPGGDKPLWFRIHFWVRSQVGVCCCCCFQIHCSPKEVTGGQRLEKEMKTSPSPHPPHCVLGDTWWPKQSVGLTEMFLQMPSVLCSPQVISWAVINWDTHQHRVIN